MPLTVIYTTFTANFTWLLWDTHVKAAKNKNTKHYGVISTCLNTRAIHINCKLATNATTINFLQALQNCFHNVVAGKIPTMAYKWWMLTGNYAKWLRDGITPVEENLCWTKTWSGSSQPLLLYTKMDFEAIRYLFKRLPLLIRVQLFKFLLQP